MNAPWYIDRYCDVTLASLNMHHAQKLYISGEACHWEVINLLASKAYQQGAEYVEVQAPSGALQRNRLQFSHDGHLDYEPQTLRALQRVLVDERWARLAISSAEDPRLLRDIDNKKNIRMQRALRGAQEEYKRAVMSDRFNWVVCAVPTAGWAAEVFGRKPSARLTRALWKALIPIYRLDRDDPIEAWKEHCQQLTRRAARLNALKIHTMRFHGPGTDLHIELHKKALWKGGYSMSSHGIQFIPNLPTEEVFTTPDFRKTSGRVRLTRPARIFEQSVEGAELEFKHGVVVRCRAKKNQEVLEGLLKCDDGAKRLGEIALVDCSSPIFQSARIFHNILLDENAACHFALGSAYPSCLEGGVEMSDDERAHHGINHSVVHNDVMIGSEDMHVDAVTYDNKHIPLIVSGHFTEHV